MKPEAPLRVAGVACAGVDRSAAVLDAARTTMTPMIRLLVSNGVGHQELCRLLKPLFIETARDAIVSEGRSPTQAALSLRAGVQRKNGLVAMHQSQASPASHPVAQGGTVGPLPGSPAGGSQDPATPAGMVVSVLRRWVGDPAYQDPSGQPIQLPFSGDAPSFQALVASVTSDYSKRSVLDELIGLGFARETAAGVALVTEADRARGLFGSACRDLAAHVGDHLEAGLANLRAIGDGEAAPYLEHSVFGNGLSEHSLQSLSDLAGEVWQQACTTMAQAARRRFDEDRGSDAAPGANRPATAPPLRGRMRFGAYLYRR